MIGLEIGFRYGSGERSFERAGLIRFDAKSIQNSLKVVVVEEFDFYGTFTFAVAEADFGAEAFLELGDEIGEVSVLGFRGGSTLWGDGARCGFLLHRGDELFGLTNVEVLADDAFSSERLGFGAVEAEQHFGVTDAQSVFAEVDLEFAGQAQEAQGIGDGDAASADLGGNVFLSEAELFDELGVAFGFFDGVETFALEILDEHPLEDGGVVGFPDNDGDLFEADELGGAPTAFARDQFEGVAILADDERLKDTLFADGVGQFSEGLLGKVAARLERAGMDTRHIDSKNRVGASRFRRGCRCGRIGG